MLVDGPARSRNGCGTDVTTPIGTAQLSLGTVFVGGTLFHAGSRDFVVDGGTERGRGVVGNGYRVYTHVTTPIGTAHFAVWTVTILWTLLRADASHIIGDRGTGLKLGG